MSEDSNYTLDDVARRFRQAAAQDPQWSDPSPGTWEAIAAATGIAPDQGRETASAESQSTPGVSRRGWLLGAGGLVVGAIAGAVGMRMGDGFFDDLEEAVRRAELTPLDRPDQRLGTAELLRQRAGYSLSVEVPEGVSNPNGYVEVWLINTDGQRMVSVGVFAADSIGRFSIDEALIEGGYLIVDLSNEQFDDEPRHSGDTIMRGELRS
ncbi:MAG TPA: anti-sigma factor [Tessaracoccus flavescens]|uniref:Anti-sigma factor n=1 Tax=Tessaracoccus flavescens TaxID=399497 RepID=A0A921EPR3_9ACTN|nr:anti-sigma factor [Tessaracoccus flavescens]